VWGNNIALTAESDRNIIKSHEYNFFINKIYDPLKEKAKIFYADTLFFSVTEKTGAGLLPRFQKACRALYETYQAR
jgi:hypothetical protein